MRFTGGVLKRKVKFPCVSPTRQASPPQSRQLFFAKIEKSAKNDPKRRKCISRSLMVRCRWNFARSGGTPWAPRGIRDFFPTKTLNFEKMAKTENYRHLPSTHDNDGQAVRFTGGVLKRKVKFRCVFPSRQASPPQSRQLFYCKNWKKRAKIDLKRRKCISSCLMVRCRRNFARSGGTPWAPRGIGDFFSEKTLNFEKMA